LRRDHLSQLTSQRLEQRLKDPRSTSFTGADTSLANGCATTR
jgi:hypothetical protein